MSDKVVVEENGMRFEMESGEYCGACELCPACDKCKKGMVVMELCEDERYHCTSATPIADTEEAKIYGPYNREDATGLVGRNVECWTGEGWEHTDLSDISGVGDNCFLVNKANFGVYLIREIPTRRLTWSQIQAEHPELAGIELVEESPNA